ncbi:MULTISPECIES: hypothetical protein [Mesobacillus]|uniref:Uncharacterized protein n=2 Tax=Mesobacillus TaxID=2675231 RepID=A0A0D6ZDJ4_9BACI|nr:MULTISPECIES: hypothetical protein [Mesobacillus]KIY22658.1 hypothetical protein UB32_07505 [Mesobacillus subterraneus]MDQ0411914.1 hypothetical protein [Mesobacillus stamsii]
MLSEIYVQSVDATTVYSVYLTLLISMSMAIFWVLRDTSIIDSNLFGIKLKPSSSEIAFKNKAELGISLRLQILKRVKIKINPGEEDSNFFSFRF